MAIVRFDGVKVKCSPVRENGSGWVMRSDQHAARLVPGTEFFVLSSDIVSMGPAEQMIGRTDHGIATLEAAMAKERDTLPSLAEVIAGNPPVAHDAPSKVNE